MTEQQPKTTYAHVGPGKVKPPDYARVVATLSTRELRDEIKLGRGEPGYQEALRRELEERDRQPVAIIPLVPLVVQLEAEELEHYCWLIDGLLRGAERLLDGDGSSLHEAIVEARDLFGDLVVRLRVDQGW